MSDAWFIQPNGPLVGDVQVHGSKNAVTKHMVAALLGDGPSTISNVPEVGDVEITAGHTPGHWRGGDPGGRQARDHPARGGQAGSTALFQRAQPDPGPSARAAAAPDGRGFCPLVGGDRIGGRPVDFHVQALESFGAEVEVTDEGIRAKCRRLHGAIIELPYPSVGATESALLSAALAEGKTVIRNAATEPEVLELALFLQRMGARVELSPDRRMVIEGVPTLRGAQTRLQGDRNEAFSYLVAGLITGGTVRVIGCGQDRLVTAITTLLAMGAEVNDR